MSGADLTRGSMATLVLSVLQGGALHGYQLAREIERRSHGYFECKEGTLYPALHKLEREGLVSSEWQQVGDTRRRRCYAITPAGERYLTASAAEWRVFATRLLTVIGE
jgi:DNA-binding PadR family transcriptional regulator